MSTDATFIFAGGGTGGHIFPALAIAEQLVANGSGARCHFLVSERPLDSQILASSRLDAGPVNFTRISAHPFVVRPRALARFCWNWGGAVRGTRSVLQEARARGTVVMIATGGFVAAPAAQAARVERVPILLVNLDAVPGKANVWISRRATQIVTAAPAEGFSWKAVPPIVRAQAVGALTPAEARVSLGLDAQRPTLLVTGGSQGASSMNLCMLAMLRDNPGALAGWQVLHQTGKDAPDEALREAYANAQVPAVVSAFVDGLGLWWNAATLALARSGAGNVAEVWANRVPAIFMPYPYHKDQHQRTNAKALVAAGGAVVHTDHIDPRANMQDAGAALARLLRDHDATARMRAALATLGPANGAQQVAELAMQMVPRT